MLSAWLDDDNDDDDVLIKILFKEKKNWIIKKIELELCEHFFLK